MPDDHAPSFVKALWKDLRLELDPTEISPERLRKSAEGAKKRMQWAFVMYSFCVLWIAAMFVLSGLLVAHVRVNWWSRAGFAILSISILGGGYVFIQRLGLWPKRSAPDSGQTECILFYRDTLVRSRDFQRGWWGLFQPVTSCVGILLITVGLARAAPDFAIPIWSSAAIFLLLLALIAWQSRRGARRVQRRIDALDQLLNGPEAGSGGT